MEYTNEEWRDIPGCEGVYMVSNYGRVKRLPLGPYRQTHNNIRHLAKKNGYLSVNLSLNNKVKWVLVHRLVALAFIPNPYHLPCVNHKDEDGTNNRVENLEWCSYKYNANYGTAIDRQRESRKSNPNDYISRKAVGEMNSKAVRQLTWDGKPIAEYKSLTDASIATGVHIGTIVRHCKGHIGNSGRRIRKFKFEYV